MMNPISVNSLTVRDSVLDDLTEIFRIQNDELVRPHQYPLRAGYQNEWTDRLSGNNKIGNNIFYSSTIIQDDQIVGFVTQLHFSIMQFSIGETSAVFCGCNLDPQFWGRGIMTQSLQRIFDQLFAEQDIRHIFADCFRDNVRCKRLLSKLGFVRNEFLLHHRVINAWETRCYRWIKRFRLDAERWKQSA